MHRGKSVAFRMLFGKSACFVPEFLTLQGVGPGHLRVQAHRETAGYVLLYQEAYILSAPQQSDPPDVPAVRRHVSGHRRGRRPAHRRVSDEDPAQFRNFIELRREKLTWNFPEFRESYCEALCGRT